MRAGSFRLIQALACLLKPALRLATAVACFAVGPVGGFRPLGSLPLSRFEISQLRGQRLMVLV